MATNPAAASPFNEQDFTDTPPPVAAKAPAPAIAAPRSTPIRDHIVKRATELGVDPDLALSIIQQESGGNPKVGNSPKGAVGIAQVMPGTYKMMMGTDAGQNDPYNSVEAGLRYLKYGQNVLKTKDPMLLAAGYHSGMDRADLKAGKIPGTNDGMISTADYAKSVAGRMGVKTNPASLTDADFSDTPIAAAKAAPSADLDKEFSDSPVSADDVDSYNKSQSGNILTDAGKSLKLGVNMAAQDVRELVGRIPVVGKSVVSGLDSVDEYFSGKRSDQLLKDDNAKMQATMTPAMQEAMGKKWWDSEKGQLGDAWTDPRTYMSGVLQSLPEQALTMGPTMALAKYAYGAKMAAGATQAAAAASAARTAAIAGSLSEGALGGAQSAREVRDKVMALPPEVLAQSEAYTALLKSGLDAKSAQRELAENLSTRAFVTSGVVTAMFGGMGDRALAKIFVEKAGKAGIKKVLGAFGKGALAEGLFEELPQSVGQQLSQNEALQQANPKQDIMDDVINQGLGGAVQGGLQGGGMGSLASIGSKTAPAAPAPVLPVANTPSEAAGPLARASENAAVQPDRVTATAPDGSKVTGTVTGTSNDGKVQIVDDNGEIVTLQTGPNGVQIEQEAPNTPLTNALEVAAEDASGQPVSEENTAPAPVESAPAATETVAEQPAEAPAEQPKPPALSEMDEPALRERLKYLGEQARSNGGWDKRLVAERRKVEKEINARAPKVEAPKVEQPALDLQPAKVEVAKPAPVQEAKPEALPKELAGAKPRYNFGNKAFELNFASDLDKAAYIAAQDKPSKRDAEYLAHAMATGMTEDEVRAHGRTVREAIKAQARDAAPGTLKIAPIYRQPTGATNAQTAEAQQTEAKRPEAPEVAPAPAAIAPAATETVAANPKAIDRIARGTAYFGSKPKAVEFIETNGLNATHDAVKGKAGRWDIVAKASAPETTKSETQAPLSVADATQPETANVNDNSTSGKPAGAEEVVQKADAISTPAATVQPEAAKEEVATAKQEAPGTRINGDTERAAADRLQKLHDQMGNITNRNSREGNAKAAVRSVIEELSKPKTVTSVQATLEKAASDLAQKFGAFSDVISEVAKSLSQGKTHQNATAPEHVVSGDEIGVTVTELKQIAKAFRDHIDTGGDAEVTHVFDSPTKDEVVRLNDKVKVHVKDKGWMTPEEAKAEIQKWKENARAQGKTQANSDKVVLSLFDLSGEWSKPWEEAGYQVYRFDIQADPDMGDVNNFSTEFFQDWFGDFEGQDIYAILAACPCTDFAVSGARHFAAKDADGRTVSSVKLVKKTLATIEYFKPAVWALENPVGRIEDLTGLPQWRLSFDPNHLGDNYTKKTLIWGRFNGDLPIAPVEPTEGSKMHRLYGGKSMATKNARSVTPEGFAYGFFQTNNAIDNPVLAIANKFDRLDRTLIAEAVDAGLTAKDVEGIVEDYYYFDLDDQGAERALREAIDDKTPPATKKPAEPAGQFANNKLFTQSAVDKARARLKSKLGQLNSGIDPEMVMDGMTIAGAYIESGTRTFAAYAKAMVEDLGDQVKPYLLSFYEAARHYPGVDSDGMSSPSSARAQHEALMLDAAEVSKYKAAKAEKPENENEPAKLDQPSARELEGKQPDAVQGSEPQREAGNGTQGGGRADALGNVRTGERGVQQSGSVGNDAREVSVPAGGATEGRGGEQGSKPVQRSERPAKPDPVQRDAGNQPSLIPESGTRAQDRADGFVITEDDAIGEGGQKTKFKQNVAAIRLLKQLEAEGRQATRAEQSVLAKYVGWGGIPQAFYRDNGEVTKGWEKEAAELKEVMTEAELAAAAASTRNAHYTSPEVVTGVWDAVKHFGFQGGRTLEPSVGVGNFFGLMPTDLRSVSQLTGVELDHVTGGIAKQLYPNANIQAPMGFQDFTAPNGYFDLAIGNPPFGSEGLYDPRNRKISGFSIHNYFFAKSIDAVKPNGVLAMVVTNRLLDKVGDKERSYIAQRAEFLGAIRLPNNAFSKNAGTEVTTDIIFLRKLKDGEQAGGQKWMEVKQYRDANGKLVPLNEYFMANPDMMLGDFGMYGSMYSPEDSALVARPGQDTPALLQAAIAKLPKGFMDAPTAAPALETIEPKGDISRVKVGSVFEQDGQIFERREDMLGKQQAAPVTFASDKARERVTGMIKVRDALIEVRGLQLTDGVNENTLEAARAELNKVYDSFVKANGPLNSDANKRLMRDDPTWAQIAALEDGFDKGISTTVAKATGEKARPASARKSAIFTKRTQAPYKAPESAKSAKDALVSSMAERGRVDLDYMASLYAGHTPDQIAKELDGLIFKNPAGGWESRDQYLSGNVKKKLAQAIDAAKADPAMRANVDALKAVQPADIEAVDIDVKTGAHWVPADVMQSFIEAVSGGERARALYNPVTASWTLSVDRPTAANLAEYSTDRASLTQVLEAAANQKQIVIRDKQYDGTSVLNEQATTAANAKVERVKAEWKNWLWTDDARRERLARIYNDTFNTDVQREFDGSHLTFPGKVGNDIIQLRPHQANAVWRMVQSGTTLLDHVVGAGKTFTMIAGIMEMRRMGLAKKPMLAVPNHLVGQWAEDFMKLYPGANILAATKKDFEKENRKKLFARIATGDWDAVIVAHSSFGKVEVEPEFQAAFIKQQIADMDTSISAMRAAEGKSSRNVKQIEKQKANLEEKLKKLFDTGSKDDNLYFSELGVDAILLDEAHEFKNLGFSTGMQRVAGLGNPAGSNKAADMFMKIQATLKRTGGKNVVFATGTPISNTMAEMYTMQRFLDYGTLKDQGIAHFDAWAKTFGEVVTDWELSPSGQYKMNSRFAKFVNMPELMQRYSSFADVVNRDDINRMLAVQGKKLPVPKIKGGKPENTVVERSRDQAQYIGIPTVDENGVETYPEGSLIWRSENLPKKAEKGADNMLKIMSDARKAALDMRLIDPSYPDNPASKVNVSADNIKTIYDQWTAEKGTQLVFIDLSTPKSAVAKEAAALRDLVAKAEEGDEAAQEKLDAMSPDELLALDSKFSVYDDLKAKLIARGIPENEIAFIHDANTELQKEDLFGKVRSGRVRVLFGSTAKMGAGMNVQERLVALHHLDAPWRPSDLEQREGRIIRQGNKLYDANPEGFEIQIKRYATKQTLDSRMWQTIEAKARFIEQVRKGTGSREVEDVAGEAANSAEMKAASSGNPLILEEMSLRQAIRKLENEQSEHNREQYRIKDRIRWAADYAAKSDKQAAEFEADAPLAPAQFEVRIGNQSFDKHGEAGQAILDAVNAMYDAGKDSREIGSYGGFKLTVDDVSTSLIEKRAVLTIEGKGSYQIEANPGSAPTGLALRLQNTVKTLKADAEQSRKAAERERAEVPKLEAKIKPWGSTKELADAKTRHTAVIEQLRPKKKPEAEKPKDDAAFAENDGAAFDEAKGWGKIDADQIEPLPTLTDAQSKKDIALLEQRLDGKRGLETLKDRPYRAVRLRDADILGAIGEAFGVRAVGFDLNPGAAQKYDFFSGVTFKASGSNAVYLGARSSRPHLALLGHETAHQLRTQRPDLYNKLVDAVSKYVDVAKYESEFVNSPVAVNVKTVDGKQEEFMGEVLSDAFMDPTFWQTLAKEGKSVFKNVYNIVLKLLGKLAGTPYAKKAAPYLTDYDRVMQIAGEVLAELEGKPVPAKRSLFGLTFAEKDAAFAEKDTAPEGLTPPEQGFLRRVQAAVQDNMNRVREVQDRIEKRIGRKLPEYADYYGAETNRPGRIAARLEDGQKELIKPLMDELAKSGHTMEQLDELLHAQHAEERNKKVAEINPEFPDGGSGMMTADANAILAKYKDDGALQSLAGKARRIARDTLDLKRAYGLIDQDAYDAMTQAYKAYVPLKGTGEYGPKIKKAMGHGEREEHILENLARDYELAVVAGERNLARQSLLQMVLQNPDSELWTVGAPPKGRYIAGQSFDVYKSGKKVNSFDSAAQAQAWIDGRTDGSATYIIQTDRRKFIVERDGVAVQEFYSYSKAEDYIANVKEPAGKLKIVDAGETVREFVKPLQDNEVMVYVDGRPVRIQINGDEKLARQLRPMNQNQMGFILEKFSQLNRYLSRIYTGYSPTFLITNPLRDMQTGTITMLGNFGAGMAAKAWVQYPAAMKALFSYARTGTEPNSKMGEMLKEYRMNGGKTGASHMSDLEEQGKTLQRLYDDAYGAKAFLADGKPTKAAIIAGRKALLGMAHVIEVMNVATENGLRLALYAAMRNSGESSGKAAQAAKNVTVNFDRKGSQTPVLSALFLFFNPAVQGTANAMRAIAQGEHKKQAWFALGVLAALGMWAAAQGLDGDEDRWLGEGWDTRSKKLVLNIGGTKITIPLSMEFAPFYAAGVAIEEARRGAVKPIDSAGRIISSFIDAYVPFKGLYNYDSDNKPLDAATSAVPTVLRPAVEAATNRNVFGSKIVPENDFTKDRPDNLKMFRGTKNSAYDAAAQGIAEIGILAGSGRYENDMSKISPETLKHWWRTYTGGLGSFIGDSVGLAKLAAEDAGAVELSDVPVAKAFAKGQDISPIRGRFYDLSKDVRSVAEEFKQAKKAGDGDSIDKIMNTPSKAELLGLERLVTKTTQSAAKLRDMEVDILADKAMSIAEKRNAVKELQSQEEALYRAAIEAIKQP